MHHELDLYDHPPQDGRVIYVDEFAPRGRWHAEGMGGYWRPGRVGVPELAARPCRVHEQVPGSSSATSRGLGAGVGVLG